MRRRLPVFSGITGVFVLLLFCFLPASDAEPERAEKALAAPPAAPAAAFDPASAPLLLKITLGLKDREPTAWDGVAHLDKGDFTHIQGWVFADPERVHQPTVSWKVQSKRPNFNTAQEKAGEPPQGGRRRPPYGSAPTRPAGIWLELKAPADAVLTVNTVAGGFKVPLRDLPARGKLSVLGGNASVEKAFPCLPVARSTAQEDYPSLAIGPEGQLYASWIAYENGSEAIYFSAFESPGGPNTWSTPRRVTGKPGIYGSTVAATDGRGRAWVIYNVLEDGQFDLWARQMAPLVGNPVRLTHHPGNDINPRARTDRQGNIWLVWQGLRDNSSDIYAIRSQGFDGRVREIQVTAHPANDWDPSVAVDSSGNAVVVWDTYRNGDYDIYLRFIDRGLRLGEETPVTATPHYEAHASATFDDRDRLWVAWEEAGTGWGKDTGQEGPVDSAHEGTMLHTHRHIRTRLWISGQWFELENGPQSKFEALPLNFQEQPQLVTDNRGKVWLLFRQWISRQNPPEVWNVYALYFDGANWSDPIPVPRSDGRLKQDFPAVAHPDGSIWTIYSTDYRGAGNGSGRQWDIYTARLAAPGSTQPLSALLPATAVSPATTYTPTPNRGYQTRIGDKTYRLFYGDLHRHTDIRGHGGTDISIPDQYRYAYDAAELDFMATTDHNLVSGDAWSDGLDEYAWWRTRKNSDLYLFPGRFVSLFAYERSFSTPGGHRNIVWPNRNGELIPGDRRIPSENIPLGLWERLKRSRGISIPHTMADKNQPRVSWEWHDPVSQPVMEMYQGARSSYEYAGAEPEESRGVSALDQPGHFLWDALERGHRIGVIASSDHGSTHLSYAAVYASDFTREAIFEGLTRRRTFASTDNIVIDFRIGEAFMGEETTVQEAPRLEIKVIGTGPLRRVDIVKDNRFLYTTQPGKSEAEITYVDAQLQAGTTSYYYVRVIQEDQMMAWSSALWVRRE